MKNRIVRMVLLALAGGIFLFSAMMFTKDMMENREGDKQAEELAQMVVATVPRAPETEPVQETESRDEQVEDATLPVEEEIAETIAAPIQVDFESLCAENPDVIGWLYCPDTQINDPVVQGEDNDYYLDHLLNGRANARGTLFMDYRNEAALSDWNTIIYGHNMKNGSMFGTLTKYKRQAYYDEHPEMYYLTPERDYLIKIVAGVVMSPKSEIFSAFCPEEEGKEKMLNSWLKDSTFVSQYEPSPEDRFITLSTCSYEFYNARYVLIGVLQ